ncbi:MAG: GNAT family N-acetyltransferase [Chloroflexota bacterium]
MSISNEIAVSVLAPDELPRAGALLARAYRDNPMMFELFGDDPALRISANEVALHARIACMKPPPLVVREGGRLLGVCGADPPGGSQMTDADMTAIMNAFNTAGPDTFRRTLEMLQQFAAKSPQQPFWNLGPVGVDPEHQGRGIASAMLTAFCTRLDGQHAASFLETDVEKNANLYARFGYELTEQATILGFPMWFMWRPGR